MRVVDDLIVGDPDPDSGDFAGAVRIAAGRNILIRGNSLFCTGTTQKGFYFDQTLQVFTDNTAQNCANPGWHSDQATLANLQTDNLQY